jgi:oligopeptide/dipeptide ABC transporter ATP-binding protein
MNEFSDPTNSTQLLEVAGLKVHFPVRSGFLGKTSAVVHAVDGVSFSMRRGETLGLVGESGSGKSTLGKAIMRLVDPTAGSVTVNGDDITHLDRKALKPYRRHVQMVFQDPYSSLNPRIPVGRIVAEALKVHGLKTGNEARDIVSDIFRKVGLRASDMQKFANEFSGGQRQRIGIARALVLKPSLIVADEAVSALDVSVQAQVVNLFADLQAEFNLSYLFIAHDLSIIAQVCDRIAVMYLGQIVEIASRHEIFSAPRHPYTRSLLDSIPATTPDARRAERLLLDQDIPSAVSPPSGCRFRTRCPMATPECARTSPEMKPMTESHSVACLKT